ncbi:unnamed protein product, partial [Symbiodinium pilosum]
DFWLGSLAGLSFEKKNIWIEPVVKMSERRSKADINQKEKKSRLETQLTRVNDDMERLETRKTRLEKEL